MLILKIRDSVYSKCEQEVIIRFYHCTQLAMFDLRERDAIYDILVRGCTNACICMRTHSQPTL